MPTCFFSCFLNPKPRLWCSLVLVLYGTSTQVDKTVTLLPCRYHRFNSSQHEHMKKGLVKHVINDVRRKEGAPAGEYVPCSFRASFAKRTMPRKNRSSKLLVPSPVVYKGAAWLWVWPIYVSTSQTGLPASCGVTTLLRYGGLCEYALNGWTILLSEVTHLWLLAIWRLSGFRVWTLSDLNTWWLSARYLWSKP